MTETDIMGIVSYIKEVSPICAALLRKATWDVSGSTCNVYLSKANKAMLSRKEIKQAVNDYVYHHVKTGLSVDFVEGECATGFRMPEIEIEPEEEVFTPPVASGATSVESFRPKPAWGNGNPANKFGGQQKFQNRSNIKIETEATQEDIASARRLSDSLTNDEEITVCGKVFSSDSRVTKNGRVLISLDITDGYGSVTVKAFCNAKAFEEKLNAIAKQGSNILIKGKVQHDTYANEQNIIASYVAAVASDEVQRTDNSESKRVELHLHTQMSAMDGISTAKSYIKRAERWGHKAIAITDHGVVQSFPEAMEAAKKSGIKVLYGMEAYLVDDIGTYENGRDYAEGEAPSDNGATNEAGHVNTATEETEEDREGKKSAPISKRAERKAEKKKNRYYHAVIFAKNLTGIKHLYELISVSHLEDFYRKPLIKKSVFKRLREGLMIGSACEAGELYIAVRKNKNEAFVNDLLEFYDYYEIQPIANNMHLVRNGIVNSVTELMEINKRIIEYGELKGKPVVATCDCHFLDKEDEVYRRVIMAGEGYKDADQQAPLFFRTTEEMLKEFDYLSPEKAYEVVVTNTNRIAEMIEQIDPIPNGTFPPQIEGSDDLVTDLCMQQAISIYGDPLPEVIASRIDRELNSIIKNGFAVMYVAAQKLVKRSVDDGYLVGSRGSVGSSLVATMMGITEVNPLPPHYLCPRCKYTEFDSEDIKRFSNAIQGGSGCDMPDKNCPVCGSSLKKDGHDIPFETFLGFDGDKEPDIDLNFSGEYQAKAHAYTEELFGSENVFKAGTISTIADKTAFGFVKNYFEGKGMSVRNAEINRVKIGCTGIKKTTGQHPGGLMILPRGKSIYEFCPVQRPANDTKSNVVTTHFDYHSIQGRLLKLDILGHDVPTIIHMLYEMTGIDPVSVPLDDKRVLSLFRTPEAMGVTPEDINCKTGSLGLPEFGTNFVRQMLLETMPETFSELVRISGLSHGTDVWANNAQELIKDGTCTLKEVIPTRDDIMVYLIAMGVEKKAAFKIMENVRKGKSLTEAEEETMLDAGVPEWYIESCKRIKYLFPKGHAVAYVTMTVRIAYFKLYQPYSFYAAGFSVKAEDFDYGLMCYGPERVRAEIERINSAENPSAKEKSTLTTLELVLEMYARGLGFAKMDLYRAEASKFLITDRGLMPPLCSIQGLGLSVSQNIVEARKEGEFFSIEEFRERTKVNKTVIELLKEHKILDGMPETDQLTLW